VILGRGQRDSWTAVGLAVNEALRVQNLVGGISGGPRDSLVAGTVDLEGETIKVINTGVLFEGGRSAEGSGDA
jgi:chemotaxis signal transduction protein